MLTDVGGIPMIQTGYGNNDGGFGSNGIWAILLLALLGGNGFGGFGRGGAVAGGAVANADNTVWEAQNFTRLENGHNAIQNAITQVGNGMCSSTFELNNSAKDGFNAMGNGICNSTSGIIAAVTGLGTQMQQCCCETNRSIDGVNFNAERNTAAIIQNATANTQRILDWMSCNELKEANAKIAEQGQLLSEARIIASMKPQAPIPSYTVPSPYGQFGCVC